MAITRTAQDERGSHQHTFRRVRTPPNFFALAGPAGPGRTAIMIAFVLGGYAVLMVLAQLRLSLVYSRLSFSPGFWAMLAVRGRLFPAS